jgi:2-methylcitrate dehydratase PrpD
MLVSATDELINFVQQLDCNLLPDSVISQARRCVLDLLGVAIAGSRTEMSRVSTRFAHDQFAPGNATLIGSPSRLSEVGATWVNGICASALDMDDGHRRAMGHPGAAVIPAALAVAETTGASGGEFLASVVAGYEIATRVSIAMLPSYRAGRYSTGIWGGFGSVAAAGKLLRLNKRTFQDALGIMAAHGPFPPGGDFVHESMVKEVIGWAGMVGCSSVLMAREGFAGPEDVLDRSGRYDTSQLVQNLGEDYAILRIYFKPYASCRWSHPAIDGVLRLAGEHGLHLEEVEEIRVEGFQPMTMLCDYRPVTPVAAQYSIPFSVALALSRGRIGPDELTEANLQDPELLGLAQKVMVSVDPELDQLFPEKTAIRLTLQTSRGDFTTTVEYPKGDPGNPLSDAELAEKFRWLTAEIVGEKKSRELKEAVDHLEQMDNVKHLAQLLAFCPT